MDFYSPQPMSNECLDRLTNTVGWAILIGLFALGIMYLVTKYYNSKASSTEKERRLDNLRFWAGVWLISLVGLTGYDNYMNTHPEKVELIENCRHRASEIPVQYANYFVWGIFGFLLIPMVIEYWSIKSGKKNPSNGSVSPVLLSILVPIILAAASYAIYYFYKFGK